MSNLKPRNKPTVPRPEKVVRTVKEKVPEPWAPSVGRCCTFYYEGGHGERYWSGGWRVGIICEVPTKGRHKNWMRVEIPIDHYAIDEVRGKRIRRLLPHEKPWVFGANVNELGDFTYHGPKLDEIVAERVAEKAADVEASAKLKAGKLRRKPKG